MTLFGALGISLRDYSGAMDEATKQQWTELCARVEVCDCPEELAKLTNGIVTILIKEGHRIEKETPPSTA